MARHLLTYLRAVFNDAVRGTTSNSRRSTTSRSILLTASAATGDLGRSQSMKTSLTDTEIVIFWRSLDQSEIAERTQLVLKLLLLHGTAPSGVRCSEVRELKLEGDRPRRRPCRCRTGERQMPPKRRTKRRPPASGAAAISGEAQSSSGAPLNLLAMRPSSSHRQDQGRHPGRIHPRTSDRAPDYKRQNEVQALLAEGSADYGEDWLGEAEHPP